MSSKYFGKCTSNVRNRYIDSTYYVRYDKGRWMICDSLLEIDENDYVHIKSVHYRGSLCLYELLLGRKRDCSWYEGTTKMCTKSDENNHLPKKQANGNDNIEIVHPAYMPRIRLPITYIGIGEASASVGSFTQQRTH